MYILIAILLLIVVIFGVSSGMQSYASVRQSQAAIEQAKAMQEVAKVGQINAQANLITIQTMALIILVIVVLAAAVLWISYKRTMAKRTSVSLSRPASATAPREQDPLEQILELEKLRLLRDIQSSNQLQLPDSQPARRSENDPLHWLR
jgi:hypothetical protein